MKIVVSLLNNLIILVYLIEFVTTHSEFNNVVSLNIAFRCFGVATIAQSAF